MGPSSQTRTSSGVHVPDHAGHDDGLSHSLHTQSHPFFTAMHTWHASVHKRTRTRMRAHAHALTLSVAPTLTPPAPTPPG